MMTDALTLIAARTQKSSYGFILDYKNCVMTIADCDMTLTDRKMSPMRPLDKG